MDQETKREIIMENYMHPTNRKRSDEEAYKKTKHIANDVYSFEESVKRSVEG